MGNTNNTFNNSYNSFSDKFCLQIVEQLCLNKTNNIIQKIETLKDLFIYNYRLIDLQSSIILYRETYMLSSSINKNKCRYLILDYLYIDNNLKYYIDAKVSINEIYIKSKNFSILEFTSLKKSMIEYNNATWKYNPFMNIPLDYEIIYYYYNKNHVSVDNPEKVFILPQSYISEINEIQLISLSCYNHKKEHYNSSRIKLVKKEFMDFESVKLFDLTKYFINHCNNTLSFYDQLYFDNLNVKLCHYDIELNIIHSKINNLKQTKKSLEKDLDNVDKKDAYKICNLLNNKNLELTPKVLKSVIEDIEEYSSDTAYDIDINLMIDINDNIDAINSQLSKLIIEKSTINNIINNINSDCTKGIMSVNNINRFKKLISNDVGI